MAGLDPALGLQAWVEAAYYASLRAGGSRLRRDGRLWMSESARPLTNPVPRGFQHTRTFYAYEPEPERLRQRVGAWLESPDEEHVLCAFGRDAEAQSGPMASHGYTLAWRFPLYAFELAGTLPAPELPGPGLELRPVQSRREIDAINAAAPPYRSHPELLGDPRVFEVMVVDGSRPIAKGYFVAHDSGIVHVLGMFTVPEHRQRGLARAVIQALHREAQARGSRWSVLNASLEAARLGVYPALGYAPFLHCARLVPTR